MRVGSQAHDTLTICVSLCQLGAVALERGEPDEAQYLLLESAALGRELGDPWLIGRALSLLVRVEVARGDTEAARLAGAELARIALDGEAMLLGDAIYGFALLLHHAGNHAHAWALLHLLNAVDAKAELKPLVARLEADLEHALPWAQQAAAIEAAHKREVESWLRELAARTFTSTTSAPDPALKIVQTAGFLITATGETLSPRELEVLRLIARGANNAAIAEQLVISLHTVKTHVAHILAKLGVASRTAAAVRARELEIV